MYEMEYYNHAGETSTNFFDHQVILFEIKNLRDEINEEKNLRASQNNELKSQVAALRKENKYLRDALDIQEAKSRKNNVIIFGLEENESNESPTETVIEICKSMNVELKSETITDAFRIGRNKGSRPIVCKVASFGKKCEIMRKSKTQNSFKILNDLTKKERRDRKEFHHYIRAAKSNGHNAFVRNGTLVVNGRVFKKADLDMSDDAEIDFESMLSATSGHSSPTRDTMTTLQHLDTITSTPPPVPPPAHQTKQPLIPLKRTLITRHEPMTLHKNAVAASTPPSKEKKQMAQLPSNVRGLVKKKTPPLIRQTADPPKKRDFKTTKK